MKQAPRRADRCLPAERSGTPSGAASGFIATSSLEDATAGRQDQGFCDAELLVEAIESSQVSHDGHPVDGV